MTDTTINALAEKDDLTEYEREQLLDGYVSLGRSVRLEGDRGLIDTHRRRELNLGQFFTPRRLSKLLAQALSLAYHPSWDDSGSAAQAWAPPGAGSVVDCGGCGIGRLFEFIPETMTLHGVELDPAAARAARLIFPRAEIVEASLLDIVPREASKGFSAALINPPFSINLQSRTRIRLANAHWGIRGEATSIPSHTAAIEIATRLSKLVGAILPTSFFTSEETSGLRRWLASRRYHPLARIDLPEEAFESEGTRWPTTLAVYAEGNDARPSFERSAATWEEAERAVAEFVGEEAKRRTSWESVYRMARSGHSAEATLEKLRVPEPKRPRRQDYAAPVERPRVRLALGGRAHKIVIKPADLVAALAVEEARLRMGWMTARGFSATSRLEWACELARVGGRAEQSLEDIISRLEALGVAVAVDDQLRTAVRRLDKKVFLELTPFRQWVQGPDGEWYERHRDLSGEAHPAYGLIMGRHRLYARRARAIGGATIVERWDREAVEHVAEVYPAFPVYDFAIEDAARALSKRGVIYSAKQGLGKTRFAAAYAIASGIRHAVVVLESRLVDEFLGEMRAIGMADRVKELRTAEDLEDLKLLNLITYNRLWTRVDGKSDRRRSGAVGLHKSFAWALAKRRPVLIVDEAHKLASGDSKRARAARYLAFRSKKVVELTGTCIRNTPRSVFGLAVAACGDGTSTSVYGYRRPVEGGYQVASKRSGSSLETTEAMVKGTVAFTHQFVDIVWWSNQFADTLSSGMKSREIPRVKDVSRFTAYIAPKVIRRVPDEPEVRASGVRTPKARPEYVGVKPTETHYAHFAVMMRHFASIWQRRIEQERATGRVTNNAPCILAELDALRFASTVPVKRHHWADAEPALVYKDKRPTAVVAEALRRIAGWVAEGNRVLVGADKPDALYWVRDLLAELPEHVEDAEPIEAILAHETNIRKRNELIARARDPEGPPVLLLSIQMGMEGLNLHSHNRLVTLDVPWVPADLDQYRHRILRPGQTSDVEIVHLYHESTIDAYMLRVLYAKEDASAEILDGKPSTFDYSDWKDHRAIALELLAESGYEFAVEELEKRLNGRVAEAAGLLQKTA